MTLEPGINQILSGAISAEITRVCRLFAVPPTDVERAILVDNVTCEVRHAVIRRLQDLQMSDARIGDVLQEFNGGTKYMEKK